jgi:hypothetical protein
MNSRITLSAVVLLCVVILIAGCTGTQSAPASTTPAAAQTAVAGPSSAAPAGASLVTGPTDSLGARDVKVNIEKDYLGVIHATFQGGPGQIHVKKIVVTANRADGEVKTGSLGVQLDDTMQLEGTKQTDRVMVDVTLDDGKTYRIYDDMIAYKPRP